jgi:hypothetical protein
MAINLKDLYDVYFGDTSYLSPVKGNTPYEYYTNDPEFVRDAKSTAKFIAQRLGVSGPLYNQFTGQFVASPATLNISDLTVYAAFEEAVTTYGNLVYQYKIRDNYINIEGSDSLPFNNAGVTFANSDDVGSPVTWSIPRLSTFEEIGFELAYSQSIADGEIYTISASLSDFISLDQKQIKSLTLATEYVDPDFGNVLDLSIYVYNQFNQIGGPTLVTPFYNANSGSFDFGSFTANNSIFSITGSNTTRIEFKITSSAPADTAATFYIPTGSTSAITAQNIANKISSVSLETFGTTVSVNTGSVTATILSFTSSLSDYNITNYKVNNTSIFSNVTSGSTYSITSGNSYVYTFVTSPEVAGGSSLFGVTGSIPTVYIQDNPTTALNNRLISNNLSTITTTIASDYGAEAEVGGSYDVKKGELKVKAGVQNYDLNAWAAASASLSGNGDKIEIRRIFYEQSPAIARYFDPYAGTGTGIQSLLETFGFGQFSPGINFLLMPISFDAMKLQAIELNDQIRKSAYSFDLVNNQLRLFPVPHKDRKLFFEYVALSNKFSPIKDKRDNVVTDIMNTPFRNPMYSKINTVGRTWIYKYTLAISREIEAHIRIQFANLNIQGIGPLQGSELITDARTEKENLISELKEMLNETSRRGQLERKQQESQFHRDTLQQIPLPIYIL